MQLGLWITVQTMSKYDPQCFFSQKEEKKRNIQSCDLTLYTTAVLQLCLVLLPLLFLLHVQNEQNQILAQYSTQNLLFSSASFALAPVLPLPLSICPLLPPYQP